MLEAKSELLVADDAERSESRIKRSATRLGRVASAAVVVCLVGTPFVVYSGMRIVDYMNDTSVRTLRDGMDQQNGTLTEVKGSIDDGVSVDIPAFATPETTVVVVTTLPENTTSAADLPLPEVQNQAAGVPSIESTTTTTSIVPVTTTP